MEALARRLHARQPFPTQISAMPTFKFIKNGEVVETVRGGNPEAIVEAIKTHKTVFATVNFGAAGSKGDGEEAALELTATQLRAVGSFMGVAEGATPGQAVAALRAASWDATGAITEFFGAGVDAAGVEVASVSTAAAGGGLAGASAGGDVKIQVRLGVDARDKHVVSLPDTATGSELLDKLATLVAADVDFTARVRLSKLKKDFALGPADLATPLAGMGLGKRGLVSLIPVNDDPAVVKVLKKL